MLPLRWISPIFDPSGYADEARTFLLSLERAGIPASAQSLDTFPESYFPALGDEVRRAVHAALKRAPEEPYVAVLHMVPHPSQRRPNSSRNPHVVRTMFETDSIPSSWLSVLMSYEEIWVPTEFNVETFQRGGIPLEKLRVLPETIDFDRFQPGLEPLPLAERYGRDWRKTVFCSNFDFTDRKGWQILLDAWAEAFSPDDDVTLLLKCLAMHTDEQTVRQRISEHLGSRKTAPIVVNFDLLGESEIARLYATVDAYVSPTHGEGWCRPAMEALACALPVIISDWSGQRAFLDHDNAFLISGELVEIPSSVNRHANIYHGQRWFRPSKDHLVELLRSVAADLPAARVKATAARPALIERFGPQRIAAQIKTLTEQALVQWQRRQSSSPLCHWRGDWGSSASLSLVNDQTARALEAGGGWVDRLFVDWPPQADEIVSVAQQWPPNFKAPSEGPFVLFQPWEMGRVPLPWLDPLRTKVDEIWVPSAHSRQAYVDSGVHPDLVHVISNGVDLATFSPDGPHYQLPAGAEASTVFLFVGGLIYRKGIDVLLSAYRQAFTAADDVLLIVKGFGGQSWYRNSTHEELLAAFEEEGAPKLLYLTTDMRSEEIAALYRSADVICLPYRGEGFCLPALEGMACARPLIVTAGGPTDEFVPDAAAWKIPAGKELLEQASPTLPLVGGEGFLLEPDRESLIAALREATNPEARKEKARHARPAAERLPWNVGAEAARARLEALSRRTPVRLLSKPKLEHRRHLLLCPISPLESAGWQEPLVAFSAYPADAEVTLAFPTAPGSESHALEALIEELKRRGIAPESLADVLLVEWDGGLEALELAAAAVVSDDPSRSRRARHIFSSAELAQAPAIS